MKYFGVVLLALGVMFEVKAFANDNCREAYGLAEGIMEYRQEGVMTVVDMMEIAGEQEELGGVMQDLIKEAYSRPSYRTEDHQRRAVNEFANDVYLECLRQAE